MSFLLTKHLLTKVANNPDFEVLRAQWEIDRRLISNALSAIQHNYPHFSLHDHSHSNSILQQVERFLGESRIELLTATDTWLLLEAAYLHDIGMVIPYDRLATEWVKPEFQNFLRKVAEDPSHEFQTYAKYLIDGVGDEVMKSAIWPLEVRKAITILIAAYFRPSHPKESKSIILNPVNTIKLDSPRNTLIPQRLFGVLADICKSHGEDFNYVLKMTPRENGLGTEDAHPRFIACLLRLGDLLDLDNNRFCPSLIAAHGNLPSDSIAHLQKHAAISGLLVSPQSIQVSAECDSKESFSALQTWLDWLDKEIKDQMSKWPQIMPAGFPGTLPTLDKRDINPKGYEVIAPTRFQIDINRARDLIRGVNIYVDEFVFVRELLQNAVDSTLISTWLDFKEFEKLRPPAELKPSDSERDNWLNYLKDCQSRFLIEVNFAKIGDSKNGDHENWQMSISDSGLGIDKDDLDFLIETLGSSKNSRKQALIQTMPLWARPSGAFGLGFQSVFQLAQEVIIETKSRRSGQAWRFELSNPNGRNQGRVLIQKQEAEKINFGARISFLMQFEKEISHFSYRIGDEHTDRVVRNYDPILDDSIQIEQAKILDAVISFAKGSQFNINLNGTVQTPAINDRDALLYPILFDYETNIELMLVPIGSPKPFQLFYRGQPIKEYNKKTYHLFYIEVNLLDARADHWLTISRNSIRPDRYDELQTQMEKALVNLLPRFHQIYGDINTKLPTETNRIESFGLLNLALYLYYPDLRNYVDKTAFKNMSTGAGDFPTYGDVHPKAIPIIVLQLNDTIHIHEKFEKATVERSAAGLRIKTGLRQISDTLIHYIKREYLCISISEMDKKSLNDGGYKGSVRSFTVTAKESPSHEHSISRDVFKFYFKEFFGHWLKSDKSSRTWFSLFDSKYKPLEVNKVPPFIYPLHEDMRKFTNESLIISPYKYKDGRLTTDGLTKLCEYVSRHSQVQGATLNQITSLYDEMIAEIENFMKDSPGWIARRFILPTDSNEKDGDSGII